MSTMCRAPVAALTSVRVFCSSPLLLHAQCTMTSAPRTAASMPAPVLRSPAV
jgi:hypothetical protein